MITIQFNAGATRAALQRARALLGDLTPVYRDIGEYMIQTTRDRFLKGVSPDGAKWPAKRAATLARYEQLGYGRLTRPLIGPSRSLSRQIQSFVSRDGVLLGSSLIYSGVQQRGAERGAFGRDARGRAIPWGRIPARVWLGISRDDETAIVAIVDDHLGEALGGG